MDPAGRSPDGLVVEGGVGVRNGRIDWVAWRRLPADAGATETIGAEGGLVTPGLVECHNRLVF
jgi:imidazolonepropionase-like amidohydrolase